MKDIDECIGPGSRVSLHFSMTLEDGTEAESTFGEEPVEITMGGGELQPGLEAKLMGLRGGDRQRFMITPTGGFGTRDPALIHSMDRDEFPKDMELSAGLIIGFTTPADEPVPGLILEIEGDRITVDFNHPLAGRDFQFDVEILSVQPAHEASRNTLDDSIAHRRGNPAHRPGKTRSP